MMAVSRFYSMIHDLSRPQVGRSSRGPSFMRSMPLAHGLSLLLALGLTALGLLLFGGAPAQAATGTASISGTVTDSNGHAITTEDICVSADPTGPYGENEGEPVARTDSSGNYTITGLKAESYKVYFADCEGSSRNDVPQYYDDQSEYDSAATIALTEGQEQTGIDASLAQATTISGNVYGGAGTSNPLEGICVYADPTSGEAGYAPDVQTGAGGSYTLAHLTPGVAYAVEFYDCRSSRQYLAQYYNDASEYASATTLTPTLASPSTGIDAHMEKGASISGTVTDSEGHPITTEDVCVEAYSTSSDDEEYYGYGEARTNASGQYTIGALAPGSYRVYFYDCYNGTRNDVSQYYYHEDNAAFAETITLTPMQEQTGIDAALEPATTISGHVYAGSGTSKPLANICVYAYPTTDNDDYIYDGSSAQTNSEGAYTLTHIVPNVGYYVEFSDCNSTREYLTQYYEGTSEYSSAKTITPTSSPLTGIDAHLEKGASISGTVTDAEGHPITTQDICVNAEMEYSSGDDHYTETVGSAMTNASGEYSIKDLLAGSYKVYFYDCYGSKRNDVPQYYDGSSSSSTASLVVLSTGGAEHNIDASMQPATSISGHVYAGAGTSTPLADVCVYAYLASEEGDYNVVSSADTATDGSYTLLHLTPSTGYKVRFYDCNATREYLTQYYNDASEYSSATILTPTVAEPSTEIDANLEKGASISGTVTDSEDHPITTQDICVNVSPSGYESYSENDYGYATTNSSGEYKVGALAPGSYDVEFSDCDYTDGTRNDLPQYYKDQPTYSTAEPVTLTAMQEQTGIDASMQPATSISGHVYAGAGTSTPLQDVCVEAYLASEPDNYDPVSYADTATDGSYTLLHLTPSTGYKVEFYDCDDPTAYETQFYEDASEYTSAKTVTPTTSPTTGIDAHLAENPLQVTITGGPANDASTSSTESSFAFTAPDTKATFECELDGKGFTPCTSPVETTTLNGGSALANGPHTFAVYATSEGKTGPQATVDWTIDTSGPTSTSSGSTAAGETFSSDPGQSPSATTPVITEVTPPAAAQVTLTNEPSTTPSENGYTVFGQQIRIAATGSGGAPIAGTTADPITLTFSLDAAEVPAGTKLSEITVLRNGSPAGNCTKSGAAEPDPCVSNRTELPGGGVQITVLTTHCSLWNFAVSPTPVSKQPSGETPSGGGGSTNATTTSSTTTPSATTAPSGGVLGTKVVSGSVSLAGSTITVQGSGEAAVKLSCASTVTCSGKLTLVAKTKGKGKKKAKAETIGTASFSIPAGKTVTVKLTLSGAGKALLGAAHGHLSATLTILKSSPTPSATQTESVHLVQQKAAKGKKGKG
jgi:protocatechuate 3,4-dioxygenase beta subunit